MEESKRERTMGEVDGEIKRTIGTEREGEKKIKSRRGEKEEQRGDKGKGEYDAGRRRSYRKGNGWQNGERGVEKENRGKIWIGMSG